VRREVAFHWGRGGKKKRSFPRVKKRLPSKVRTGRPQKKRGNADRISAWVQRGNRNSLPLGGRGKGPLEEREKESEDGNHSCPEMENRKKGPGANGFEEGKGLRRGTWVRGQRPFFQVCY